MCPVYRGVKFGANGVCPMCNGFGHRHSTNGRAGSGLDKEGIRGALFPDGSESAVSRINERLVRQLQQLAAKRIHNLLHGTAPEVGTANAAGEERVAGEKPWRMNRDD